VALWWLTKVRRYTKTASRRRFAGKMPGATSAVVCFTAASMHLYLEAVTLGLFSGPVCVAACGHVLAPTLAATGRGWRGTAALLSVFLGGRLAGYLGFSVLAWASGQALPNDAASRTLVFGSVDLGLAVMLAIYALAARGCQTPGAGCKLPGEKRPPEPLVTIQKRVRPWLPAGALGLFTGLSLCPPFVAAGARAAQTQSLSLAVAFFFVFFLGTAVWTLPLVGIAWLRRFVEVAWVARACLLILAGWYAYLGVVLLVRRLSHG
jgi:sulfite exporter TauE/SafE